MVERVPPLCVDAIAMGWHAIGAACTSYLVRYGSGL